MLLTKTADQTISANLAEAFARLCGGDLFGFEGLTAHQRHGWDLFLFQAAAMALVRSDESGAAADDAAWTALVDPDAWAERLRALAPGDGDDAWSLVVDDLRRPALLQPPIPSGTLDGYSLIGQCPDEIDVLVTSKAHDVKPARAGLGDTLTWLFALVTLQTMQGYSGCGNFGIARMNGGFGSRPLLMASPSRELPARFRRGVQAALAAREAALRDAAYYQADGLALLWLEPWADENSLSLGRLDPLFIEVCRRIRLVRNDKGQIEAWGRPSEVARVSVSKDSGGHLGDAWTPVSADGKALTVGAGGFDYRLMTRLLGKEFRAAEAMQPPPGKHKRVWLQASVLVRGKSKTEGLHERWLLMPATVQRRILDRDPEVGRIASAMVEEAGQAQSALRWGLLSYLQGGPDKPNAKDERPKEWIERLDRRIDGIFFGHLFGRIEASSSREAWLDDLGQAADRLFDDALKRLSPPDQRRERARVIAEQRFLGAMKAVRSQKEDAA